MFKRIDHVAVHVSDLDRSVDFYEKYFGFKKYFQNMAAEGMQIAYLKLGDTVLELTHRSDGSMKGFHFSPRYESEPDRLWEEAMEEFAKSEGKVIS